MPPAVWRLSCVEGLATAKATRAKKPSEAGRLSVLAASLRFLSSPAARAEQRYFWLTSSLLACAVAWDSGGTLGGTGLGRMGRMGGVRCCKGEALPRRRAGR
jgi:hypothetical protein